MNGPEDHEGLLARDIRQKHGTQLTFPSRDWERYLVIVVGERCLKKQRLSLGSVASRARIGLARYSKFM